VPTFLLPVTVALRTKMGTDYLWNDTKRERTKYFEPEIDVNYI
jgi:hypothetical protein